MGLIQDNDRGPAVLALQRALIAAGFDIDDDGIFGDETETALRAYQRSQGLIDDGIYGPVTRDALAGTHRPQALTRADLEVAAKTLDVELAVVMAVTEVEARGEGFIGRLPVVLFERHIMYRRLDTHGLDADALAGQYPRLVNTRPGGYTGGTAENARLAGARRIHDLAGAESASYGLFQIMGFHAERLGYGDAAAFAQAMTRDESAHLDAFVRFVQADDGLLADMQARDWAGFARRYNGPAYERNDYDTKLAAAYRRHARYLGTHKEAA